MTGRKLRPEERALWDQIAAKTQRLEHRSDDLNTLKSNASFALFDPQFEAQPSETRSSTNAAPAYAPTLAMDKRAFGHLKRGKLVPEAKIDLHGMTLDRAHPALTQFIMRAWHGKKRLVLVITGKGKDRIEHGPIPMRRGVLRQQVPQWLSLPPLKSVVLQVADAHQRHGGGGAYYVYLRRQR